MSNDLPYEKRVTMLPIDGSEDDEWNRFHNWLDDISIRYRLTTDDLKRYIEAGIYDEFKDIVNK
tara:strand:+ start:1078 stop:1269 length:192 start_codon:yes stop_codon:yes gene_type:complete